MTKPASFRWKTVRKMGEMGLMGIEVPEEYGGAGMDTLAYVLAMIENRERPDASHSTVVSVNNSLVNLRVIEGLAVREQRNRSKNILFPIASGEKISAYSLTEPMSGSDAATMRSRAVLSDDGTHYILNGRKAGLSSGPVAEIGVAVHH